MHITSYTVYALRALMYLVSQPEERVTVADVARRYGISRHHLLKVVGDLRRRGYVETTRGNGGGIRLGCRPEAVRVGDVVRAMEDEFVLASCLSGAGPCRLESVCRLRGVLQEALDGFLRELNRYTLADLRLPWPALVKLLEERESSAA